VKNINLYSNEFNDALKTATVLYVECDDKIRNKTNKYLRKFFKNIICSENILDSLDLFSIIKIDIIVTNSNIPVVNGVEFLEKIKNESPNLPCVVILTNQNSKDILDLISLGINHIVTNSSDLDCLLLEIKKAYKLTYYYNQLQTKEQELKKLNGLAKNQILDLKYLALEDNLI